MTTIQDEFTGKGTALARYRWRHRDRQKKWNDAHREELRASNRKSYQKHREERRLRRQEPDVKQKTSQRMKIYCANHREEHKAYRQGRRTHYWALHTIRRHQERGFLVCFSISDLERFVQQRRCCYLCGEKLDWAPDRHGDLIPTLDRLTHERDLRLSPDPNVNIACHLCNRSKNSRTLNEYLAHCERVLRHVAVVMNL